MQPLDIWTVSPNKQGQVTHTHLWSYIQSDRHLSVHDASSVRNINEVRFEDELDTYFVGDGLVSFAGIIVLFSELLELP